MQLVIEPVVRTGIKPTVISRLPQHVNHTVIQPDYSASPWRTSRYRYPESPMKPDAALVRLIETTRHFWGLGVSPLSGDQEAVRVDFAQQSGTSTSGAFVATQVALA